MGLDMYLYKIHKNMLQYKNTNLQEVKEENSDLYKKLESYIIKHQYGAYTFETLTDEVGYWRKANEIHNWFVKNVQNGEDDCGLYEVSKDQIKDLLEVCKKVQASIQLIDSPDGMIVEDYKVAEELLPTISGFFFGGTSYDQFYAQDIDDTIQILRKILINIDFDNYSILYSSSW